MDCLRLWGSVVVWSPEVPGHTDHRSVTSILAPLADGALAGAAFGDGMLIAATAVILAA